MKCTLLGWTAVAFVSTAAAQVKIGDNRTVVHPDAILELESSHKGVLLPRLQLDSTTSPAPLSAFTKGMFVYNTHVANDVVEGIYYSDGTRWFKMQVNTPSLQQAQRSEITVSVNGQTNFNTPGTITDPNLITLYRNGVRISFTTVGNNQIVSNVPCIAGDEITIVQLN